MRRVIIAGAVVALALGFSEVVGGQDTGAQGQTGRLQITNRPRLGLSVDINRSRPTDSIGTYIEGVTPGSPAEKAGIRPGDIIVKVGKQAVVSPGDKESPGLRLIGLAARLEPNVPVSIELCRGTARKTVSVVPAPDVSLELAGMTSDSAGKWSFRIQPGDSDSSEVKRFFVFIVSPWAELETAALNPQLGEYFGTTEEGVLIVSAPSYSKLGLKGGDVVLTVDGKKPADPAQFMRMVQNESGATKLVVLRHRKRHLLKILWDPDSTIKR